MEKKKKAAAEETPRPRIRFSDLMLLYLFGSLAGVLIEGVFCAVVFKQWEMHVVSVWLPLCSLYGLGAMCYYSLGTLLMKRNIAVKFIAFALLGSLLELIVGWALYHGLHMRAWDYSLHFMNIKGYISLEMGLGWGLAGMPLVFLLPYMHRFFNWLNGRPGKAVAIVLFVFFLADVVFTFTCAARWSQRHRGVAKDTAFGAYLDEHYPDDFMEKRFMEWHFVD